MKKNTLFFLLAGGLILLLPLPGGYSSAQTPAEITATPPSTTLTPAQEKAEEKRRKEEEERLKKEEKERAKDEAKRKKEEEKRRSKLVVKNPETPEGRAAEMIVKFYEFYFPIMLVFEENEDCLRKAGISKGDLCSWLMDIGAARITSIDTKVGKAEPYGGKQRTTIAATMEGTVVVKGKKRKVSREEIFYLDATRDSSEFADSHGMFRLTFRKDGSAGGE
jgi:hypothetical protein